MSTGPPTLRMLLTCASAQCLVTSSESDSRNGFCSTNLRLRRVIIFALLPQLNLSGEFEIMAILQCLMPFRLLEHASSYYELGSFPDSGMKRALQNLERRRLVSGEDGGRKIKKQKVPAWFPKPSSFFDSLLPGFVVLSCFARVVLYHCFR